MDAMRKGRVGCDGRHKCARPVSRRIRNTGTDPRVLINAKIRAACGVTAFATKMNGTWRLLSDDEAQSLRDAGRTGEVEEVYLQVPDADAFAWLWDHCPPDLQDFIAQKLREQILGDPTFLSRGISALRRVAEDPAAPAEDRATAQAFLKRFENDDSLDDDEDDDEDE